jgi:hypothetical protein
MADSVHFIHIENVFAEDLLQLPEGVRIHGAKVVGDELVLTVISDHHLGADDLNALYGNIEEDEKRVHLGMLEPRVA